MSDRKLLSAAELGITEVEREELLRVRHNLASGYYREWWVKPKEGDTRPVFHMDSWLEEDGVSLGIAISDSSCDTVGCIGGWMQYGFDKRGVKPFKVENENGESLTEYFTPPHNHGYSIYSTDPGYPLHNLFYEYPWAASIRSRHITPAMAVEAIDRFLTTGTDDPWQTKRKRK